MIKNNYKYDVVFWAYNSMVVDRCIPLMVSLNKKGYKTLLFYQDYGMHESLAPAQKLLIERYNLNLLTYEDFLDKPFVVEAATWSIRRIGNTYLRDKLRGLRSKLLTRRIDKDFIRKLLEEFRPRLNIYDTINLATYGEYPIGSFYIKRISDEMGIPGIAIPHGIRTHYKKDIKVEKFVDFNKVVICNEQEREYMESICTEKVKNVIPIGDPRYDSSWKSELSAVFQVEAKGPSQGGKRRVLYLLPSMEQFGMEEEVYKALAKVASMAALSGDIKLLIRPHPRHRHKDRISKVMRKNGLEDFEVIGNDPLIFYAKDVEYVISPVTSALFDFMPEMYEKVIIYYEFLKEEEFINIFRDKVSFFDDIDSLSDYVKKKKNPPVVSKEHIARSCDEWAANGEGLDTIIDRYTDLIHNEIQNGEAR